MSKVPTQNSVQEISDSLAVIEGSSKAIANTVSAVIKIIEKVDVSQIKGGDKKMRILSQSMSSYTTILGVLIDTLNKVTPEGKSLETIFGKLEKEEKKSDGTIEKVTKWTNLDALLNVSNIMSGLIKGVTANDQISKSSIFARKKLKKDIEISVSLAMFAFTSMIDELMKIENSGKLTELMEILVDGPEIVTEHMTRRDDSKKMEKQELIKIQENTDKITKKGKVGLVNALKGVFDLLKMMLELEPPGIIGMVMFKKKMQDFGKMLTITIEEFTKLLNSLGTDELLKTSVISCKVISGTGKEGEDGILGVITNIFSIIDIINGISIIKLKITNKNIDAIRKLFNKLINDIVELFIDRKSFKPKKEIEALISKDLTEMLEKTKDQLNLITDIFAQLNAFSGKVILFALASILAIPSIFIAQLFLICFSKLIGTLQKTFEKIDYDKLDPISDNIKIINSIIKQLIFTELWLIALGLLAMKAVGASLKSILFIWALVAFTWAVSKAFDIITKFIKGDISKNITEFANTLLSLIKIQVAVILTSLLALPAIIAMLLTTAFMWALVVFLKATDKAFDVIARIINRDMKKDIREFSLTLASLVLIQLSIILIAKLAIITTGAMLINIIFLLVLIVFILVTKLVFKVIDKLINKDYKKSISEVAITLLLIIGIQLAIIAIAYLAPKTIASMLLNIAFLVALTIFVLILWVVLKIIDKLIKAETYKTLAEVALVVLILLAIEIMMIIMGSMAVDAMINTVLAIVFVIVLTVFVVIVGVLLTAVSSTGIDKAALIGMVSILAVTALLVAIAALMISLSNMWESLDFGGLMAILGTILLAVLLEIVIGVLGLATVVGIPGMIFTIIVTSLLLGVASLMTKIQQCGLDMSIMDVLGTISLAILAIVGIGLLGITALFALAFMPMNLALVGMFFPVANMINQIGQFEIDENSIRNKIDTCRNIMDYIKESFGDITIFEESAKKTARLNMIDCNIMLMYIQRLAFKLGFIGRLKIDANNAIKNVNLAFDTIFKIEDALNTLTAVPKDADGNIDKKALFNNVLEEVIQGAMGKAKMNRADKVLVTVYSIVSKLNKIQEFTINYDKIAKTLDSILGENGILDKIESYIDKKNALPEDWDAKDLISMWVSDFTEDINNRAQLDRMNRTDKILTQIHNIVKNLNEISKFSINKDTITTKLENIFSVVDYVDTLVQQRNALTEEEKEELIRRMRLNSLFDTDVFTDPDEMIKMAEAANIDRTTKIVVGIGDMTRALKDIVSIKVTPSDAVTKTQNILDCVDQIYSLINARTINKSGWFAEGTESSVNKVCEEINLLNDSLKGLSGITEADVKNSKNALDNYSKFLTKIDNLKIDNLEKSATMFEHMARFSESISGNFEKLSESINEDLMPVLEELKKIMAQVPEAVEKSSANISASVAANNNNQLSNSENVAQIQRENPNISEPEAVQKALQRTQQQAAKQAGSVSAKLDKLISMLSNGSAKVKTSIW